MKKVISLFLSIVIMLSVTAGLNFSAFAATNGIYTYTISDNEITITKVNVESANGSVVVPAKLDGYNVVRIGHSAFEKCGRITDITLSDGIREISYSAFQNCSFKSITIPASVETIDFSAFYGCNDLERTYFTGTVNEWAEINFDNMMANPVAYSKCLYINNVPVEDIYINCNKVNSYAFSNCITLNRVTIDKNVEEIGDSVFRGCTKLNSIIVDSANLFYSSENDVLFDKNKKELITYPVGKTDSSYSIPDGITTIGSGSFYKSENLVSVSIPNSVTIFDSYSFYNCKKLEDINIPNRTKEIRSDAFRNCVSLKNIIIPNSVLLIDSWAFDGCTGLTDLNLGDNINMIGHYAFYGCINLKSLEIVSDRMNIDYGAFAGCTNLKNILISGFVNSIGKDAFEQTAYYEDETNWENGVLYIDNCLIRMLDSDISNYQIKSNTNCIADYAFSECENLISVEFPSNIQRIGCYTFSYCTNLTNISIPNSVTNIDYAAFKNCSSLHLEAFPNNIVNIGNEAFYGCNNLGLREIHFSTSLNRIHQYAFPTSYIKKIFYDGTVNQWESIVYQGEGYVQTTGLEKTIIICSDGSLNCDHSNKTKKAVGIPSQIQYICADCESILGECTNNNLHEYELVEFQEATCDKNGFIKYVCSNCKNEYIGKPLSEMKIIVDSSEYPESLHNYENNANQITEFSYDGAKKLILNFSEDTCVENNYDYIYLYDKNTVLIDKYTGESLAGKIIEIEGDCFKIGLTSDGSVAKYGFSFNSITACIEDGSEDYNYLKATGIHTYDNGIITKESTCISKGTKKFTCTVCGDSYTEEMPETDHTIVTDNAVSPTCTSTGLTEGSHCSVCNEVFKEQETIPTIPHRYVSSVVQATANSQGYTKYTCSLCGDTYNTDYFDAATVYSDIKKTTAGEILRIPVYIKDNNGLMGWKLSFEYDKDVLTPVSVENGDIISNGYLDNNIDGNMKPGSINVYWSGDDNKVYNGIMFYINFVVNDNAVGNTNVDVSFSQGDTFDLEYNDVYLNCEQITFNIENDKYLKSAKINTNSENITAGDDLELKLNISEIKNVSETDITVEYDAENFEFKTIDAINGIKVENSIFAGKLIISVSGITESASDKNFITVIFKCKDNAVSGDYSLNVASNDDGIICKGCTVNVSPSATSELARVYAEPVNANKDDIINIPIMIDNNHGVMGYGLNFTYDTSMLEIVSATRGSSFSGNFNDSIGVDNGDFIVLWNGTDNNYTNGNLLNLKFRVLSDEITDTAISMTFSQDDTFNENWEDVVFNCSDINVSLNKHQHSYTAVVTEPTCTEKGYTTYTCTCGDSYIDDYVDALGHNFGEYVSNNDATYEADGTKTAVCTRCSEIDTIVDEGSKLEVKEPDLSSFVIDSASLTLQNSIKMNFMVYKSALKDYENPYMVFECEGLPSVTVTEYTEDGEYYVFAFPGISPKMMNNQVTAKLYATYKENGKLYSSAIKSLSVKDYCYKVLTAYENVNTVKIKKLKTLIVDLLNYGAYAQIYTNYKKNNLVNADLTDLQKSWGTAATPQLTNITDKEYKTISNPTAQWDSAALVLTDSVKVKGIFIADNVENVTVKIICAGNTYTYTKEDFTKNKDGSYNVICSEIKSNQMSKEILMTVYDNGVQCSNTLKFSVESYASAIQNSAYAGTALDNLTQAMMRYGKSAEAYGA